MFQNIIKRLYMHSAAGAHQSPNAEAIMMSALLSRISTRQSCSMALVRGLHVPEDTPLGAPQGVHR